MTGCAFLRDLVGSGPQRPDVHLESLKLVGLSLHQVDVVVRIRARNTNSYDLILDKLRYQALIGNTPLGKGRYNEPLKLLAQSSMTIDLPITLEMRAALDTMQKILAGQGDSVMATVTIEGIFRSPAGPLDFGFTEKKSIGQLVNRD